MKFSYNGIGFRVKFYFENHHVLNIFFEPMDVSGSKTAKNPKTAEFLKWKIIMGN